MSEKSFKTVTQELSKGLAQFRGQVPEVQASFSALHQAAMKDGELDAKTKELIALAIGVAARCDGCIGFHSTDQTGRHQITTRRNARRCRDDGRWPIAHVCRRSDARL